MRCSYLWVSNNENSNCRLSSQPVVSSSWTRRATVNASVLELSALLLLLLMLLLLDLLIFEL